MAENSLCIHLLGSPRILVNGDPVRNFPTAKVKSLFFYLMLFHQSAHSRPQLEGIFWGESAEARARHSLSTALWRLRRWLASIKTELQLEFSVQDGYVRLELPRACWLDTLEFERCLRRARAAMDTDPEQAAAALRQAVDIYAGDLLDGSYADWSLVERDRLRELFQTTLLELMVYHGKRREFSQAISFGQRIVREDPLREEVQRELIKLYALSNQPAQAMAQYNQCQVVLMQELGIEPMPETQAVFRQVLLGAKIGPVEADRARTSPRLDTSQQMQSPLKSIERALQYVEALQQELNETLARLRQQDG